MSDRAQINGPPSPLVMAAAIGLLCLYVGVPMGPKFAAVNATVGFIGGYLTALLSGVLLAPFVYLIGGTVRINGKEYTRKKNKEST